MDAKSAPPLAQVTAQVPEQVTGQVSEQVVLAIKKPPLLGALAPRLKGGVGWLGVFGGEAEFG